MQILWYLRRRHVAFSGNEWQIECELHVSKCGISVFGRFAELRRPCGEKKESESAIEGTHKPNEYVKWIKFGFYDINFDANPPVRRILEEKRKLVILIWFNSFRISSRSRKVSRDTHHFRIQLFTQAIKKIWMKKKNENWNWRLIFPRWRQKVKWI